MAADLQGFTEQEVLNKVLNTSNDSIKVDIVAGAEYAEDSQHTDLDTGQFVLGVRNDALAALGGTDGDYVPFQMNASGALYIDVADGGQLDTIIDTLETTLTAIETDQAAIEVLLTAANVDHAAIEVLLTAANVDHAANEALLITIDEDTNAIKGHVDGIETLITSTNTKLDTLETTNNANQVLLGTIDSDTDAIKTAVELIDDTVAVLGTATYSETSTKGSVVGVVRNDTLAPLAGTDNEVAPLQVNAAGALYTSDASGEAGSIFVSGTNAITTTVISNTVFVAIQFITDTVFNSGNTGLVSATDQLYPSTQYLSTSIDADDGAVVDGVTFPQGMTIFGRWSGFQLASGKVIAYIGYV